MLVTPKSSAHLAKYGSVSMDSISIDQLIRSISIEIIWKRGSLVSRHLDRSTPRASISIEVIEVRACLDDFYLDRIAISRQGVNEASVNEDGVNEKQCKRRNVVTSVNEGLVYTRGNGNER